MQLNFAAPDVFCSITIEMDQNAFAASANIGCVAADDSTFAAHAARILLALNKLFWKVSSQDSNSAVGATSGSSRLAVCDHSVYGQRKVQLKAGDLSDWLIEQRELLLAVHDGDKVPDLSPLLLDDEKKT